MEYCSNSSSLTHPWVDKGISHCFLDTLTASVLFLWILIAGLLELNVYRKYSTPMNSFSIPKSCLYKVQVFLHLAMMLESVIRLGLQATEIEPKEIYGYQILYTCCTVPTWFLALLVMHKERTRMLPSIPSRGHGLVLLFFWTTAFVIENLTFISWFSSDWWFKERNYSTDIEMGLWIFRYVTTSFIFILGIKHPGLLGKSQLERMRLNNQIGEDEEALLGESSSSSHNSQVQHTETESTWSSVGRKLKMLLPFLWPKKNVLLQLCVLACIFLLICGRVVNLFIPIYYKHIVDSLTYDQNNTVYYMGNNGLTFSVGKLSFRWDYVLIYTALKYCGGSGSMGLFNNLRSLLWIWVQQYTTREVGVKLYEHLHGLSLRWHLSRKTGEVLRVMDRGTSSINQLLNYIVFQISPTFIDIFIAIIYFLLYFDYWFAVIVLITMVLYLLATFFITEWRTKFRRRMNKTDNERNAKGVDSLLNFETVKYYGAEEFEVNRYREAIVVYQKAEWKAIASLSVLNTAQNIIINGGYAAGALLCAWYVADNKGLTVGDFVLFSTYIIQLYTPLNWLGTYYRMIQAAFIDMENMFELLTEEQEVKDSDECLPLVTENAHIKFDDVSFHYDPKRPILKSVSFDVPPGNTVALVGQTGSGKSTIIRLLFRFYDVNSGVITIDDQDISKVTQTSLRTCIGVVPQDTVLFNDDIGYNIRYGRVNADDLEVENAAKAADIHAKIMTFPEKYDTKVGERGLKLSGGEKQRVAIARTILKSPQIVLLDEATSALDTQTERNIQSSLAKVCENRTTIIVAHRLSTIIHADNIIVLQDGVIAEQGRHEELLAADNIYANMWHQQQTKVEQEDEGVADLKQKAEGKKDEQDSS